MGCCGSKDKDKVHSYVTNDFELVPSDEDYGEPLTYDRSFKGPLHNRSCTDVLCLIIFAIFLGCWGYIGYYAFTFGDLHKLLTPTDSLNRKCGQDSGVLDKPYLFFFNLENCIDPLVPITGCKTPQVCVEKCPDETFVYNSNEVKQLTAEQLKRKLICLTEKDYLNPEQSIEKGRCARWYVKSKPFFNRCIPADNAGFQEIIARGVNTTLEDITEIVEKLHVSVDIQLFGQKVVEDIVESWPTVLGALIIAMVVSLIFIALMRWIAAPVLWFSIIGALAALGFAVYFCVSEYIYWRDNPNLGYHSPNLSDQVKTVFQKKSTWLYLSIALSIILLVILLLVIFLRERIVIAIALVKEGSKAVGSVISSVFFPIFPWCLQILTLGFAIGVGLYLASIGDASFRVVGKLGDKCLCSGPAVQYTEGGICNPKDFNTYCTESAGSTNTFNFFRGATSLPCTDTGCYFEKIQSPNLVTYFHIYNVIGFFWLAFFISAFGEMVLAATFATWYWTFHKSDVPYFTTTKALCRTIRYHLGTLAFGSLILTICRIIRLILEFIETKLKKYDNACTRALLCCMKCFFYCLETFLRFLNRNAYIMCAIHGKNFCLSAKDAFNLLMRNVLRVVTVDKVTDFLFFLSKLLLTITAGAATYFYVEDYYKDSDKLYYSGVPTAIVAIGTYLITSIFFGVYSMAVDTLFLCFLEDCERNDGSEEKPYYMSKQLMKILGKKNIIPRHQYR